MFGETNQSIMKHITSHPFRVPLEKPAVPISRPCRAFVRPIECSYHITPDEAKKAVCVGLVLGALFVLVTCLVMP